MQNNANNTEPNSDCFKVFVRIRPLSEKENLSIEKLYANTKLRKYPKSVLVREDNLLFVLDPDKLEYNGRKERNFVFDDIFEENNNNTYIFESVIKNNIDNVLNGFNSTALAYGVTGTGKTHTIFGDMRKYVENYDNNLLLMNNNTNNNDQISNLNFINEYNINSQNQNSENLNIFTIQKLLANLPEKFEMGVCVHAVDYLFSKIESYTEKKFHVKISYLEIYNEQVIDLLIERSPGLMIVEDAHKGIVVPDLTELAVNNSSELIKLIILGNSRRTMAATGQNLFSSRSHAILQIIVEQHSKLKDVKEEYLVSKFLLVDLAGSERGGLEKGIRTHEGKNINKSLLSLGNCINILSDKSKKGAFVPYRDSKLTRLLKDSLGGNIMTVMIACVSPSPISYDETVNTLKYASRARKIEKKIFKNIKEVDVHISQYREIIDSLKSEIEQLKQVIKEQQDLIQISNVPIVGNTPIESPELKSIKSKEGNKTKDESEIDKEKDENENEVDNFEIENENFNNDLKNNINVIENINMNINNSKLKYFENDHEKIDVNLNIKDVEKLSNKPLKTTNSSKSINNILKSNNEISNSNSSIKPIYTNVNSNKTYDSSNNLKDKSASKKNLRDYTKENSVYGSGSKKLTYTSINQKRTYTQKNLNETNYKNFSKRLSSENNLNYDNKNLTASPHSINVKDFDISGYKSFLHNNSIEEEFNLNELEKHVENLQNDKLMIEDLLEKGGKNDKTVNEKYKLIKSCYEKYLDYINEKLIQNIEESMILKFNLKEILDLNLTNQNNIKILSAQINNLQKLIDENEHDNKTGIDEEITKLQEEIENINNAILENDGLKEKIAESLKKNLRFKNFLKKILLKLISKTHKKETNLEEAYVKIIKEKEELEKKNKTYEKHLTTVIKEKHLKESKLDRVQEEVNRLRKIIEEKDNQIKVISSNFDKVDKYKSNVNSNNNLNNLQMRGREISKNSKKFYPSKSMEKDLNKQDLIERTSLNKNLLKVNKNDKSSGNNLLNSKTKNSYNDNFSNLTCQIYEENLTDVEKIEINLQDEYVGTKKKFINDINQFSNNLQDNENIVNEENVNEYNDENKLDENPNIKIEINVEDIIYNKNSNLQNSANIQNIKYIINQTNNIVNNNINKVIELDKENKAPKNFSSRKTYNAINKITVNRDKNSLNKVNSKPKMSGRESMNGNNKKNRVSSQQKSLKKTSIISNKNLDFYEEKILNTNNINIINDNFPNHNLESLSNNHRSPRNSNNNIIPSSNYISNLRKEGEKLLVNNNKKLKEFDKIIENQLNEVYSKKAKEIGDKIKKKIKNPTNSNKEGYNNFLKGESEKNSYQKHMNKSLSISCVSINNEVGFYSELDIVDQMNDKENMNQIQNIGKNEININLNDNKPMSKITRNQINTINQKRHKKISMLKVNNAPVLPTTLSNNKPYKLNSDKNIKEIIVKKHNNDAKDNFIYNPENFNLNTNDSLKINQEKQIKNIEEKNKEKDTSSNRENTQDNKKPVFNINPSPIKIDNHFANNFINSKKTKPFNLDYNSNENRKSLEKYINMSRNFDNLIACNNQNEFNNSYELDEKYNQVKKGIKKDEKSNNPLLSSVTSTKNSNEKPKKSLINPIPYTNSSAGNNTNNKVPFKLNSSKTIQNNVLMNSSEIREDILSNMNNMNSNKNVNYSNNKNSQSNLLLNHINVQKFINTNNKFSGSSDLTNAINQLDDMNFVENFKKIDIANHGKNFKSEKNVLNHSKNKEIENTHNNLKSSLIREKSERYNSLKINENKLNGRNLNIYDLTSTKERSPSLLKKARLERKKQKIEDYSDQNSINKRNNSNNNLQFHDKSVSVKNDEVEKSRHYSPDRQKNKYCSSLASSSNNNNDKNENKNKNYLRNYFNSYKTKKLENNLIRKGSNISKNSVDFVNEYINQKRNKNSTQKEITAGNQSVKNFQDSDNSISNLKIKNSSSIIKIKNENLCSDDIEIYDNNYNNEIKAIFVHKRNSSNEKISKSNADKSQEKQNQKSNNKVIDIKNINPSSRISNNLQSDLYNNLLMKNREKKNEIGNGSDYFGDNNQNYYVSEKGNQNEQVGELNTHELFKSLNDIKNPKFTKFLYKNN